MVYRYRDYATTVCLTLEFLPYESIHRAAQALHRASLVGGTVFILCSDACLNTAVHITQIFHQLACSKECRSPFSVALVGKSDIPNEHTPSGYLPQITEQRLAESLSKKDVVMLVGVSDTQGLPATLTRAQEQHAMTVGWMPDDKRASDNAFDITLKIPNERTELVEIAFEIIAHILVDDFRHWSMKNEMSDA